MLDRAWYSASSGNGGRTSGRAAFGTNSWSSDRFPPDPLAALQIEYSLWTREMAVAYAPLFSRRCVRRSGTESLQTLRWREPDSNHRSRRERDGRGERSHGRPSSSREATKQGISSIELGRRLGVSQTTAW